MGVEEVIEVLQDDRFFTLTLLLADLRKRNPDQFILDTLTEFLKEILLHYSSPRFRLLCAGCNARLLPYYKHT